MEQMHATYQALKNATEHLYGEIRSKQQELAVNRVKPALDASLKALEDELGITKARILGLRRKKLEDATPPPQLPAEPSVITEKPGDIAARANDALNQKAV